uniref:Major facilitator superfamily (MFS) profile domain-containing protein n=1 Tax=Bionectria ochroleuca TaxID=29856 RepID=A0A8H7K4A7_BIOOC
MAVLQATDKNNLPEARHQEIADGDAGVPTIADHGLVSGPIRHLSPEENKRVLRRIDLILMPIMFISYGLQYMDKAILGAASQFGVVEDVGLYDVVMVNGKPQIDLTKFSLATLIFYWGFAAGAFPASFLSSRFPIGIFCGLSVFVWGLVTMAAALVHSYSGMMALRFFLGFIEAAIPAAFSLIIAMWYKPDEQPLRFAIWVSASGIGGVLGTVLLWGVGHINGSLSPWKYQFIISCFCLFLSEKDRTLAVDRIRACQTAAKDEGFKLHQVKEAFQDPKTWAYIFVTFSCQLANGAVSGFGPIIISSFGFGPLQSVLIAGSLGGTLLLSMVAAGLITSFIPNQKCNVAFATCLPIIIGCAIVWKASWNSLGVPLFGFLLVGFFATPYVMILSLVTANTAGQTKKVVVTGMVWFAYCVSNGVAPLLVRSTEQAQHYPSLFIPILSLLSAGLLVLIALRWYLSACNKSREADALSNGGSTQSPDETASLDLTDKENPNFRYHL